MAYSGLNSTFTDALMNLRRRNTLQGRPTTQAETAGAVEGMASSASDRLAKAKAAAQGDRALDLQQQQMRLQSEDWERQAGIAAKQMRQEKYKNYATTGLLGAGTAYQMLRPATAAATSALPNLSTLTQGASGYVPAGATAVGIGTAAPNIWNTIKGLLGF